LQNKERKEVWAIGEGGYVTGITKEKMEGTLERQRVPNSGEGDKNLHSGLPLSWK
jgi:hypothetical protein